MDESIQATIESMIAPPAGGGAALVKARKKGEAGSGKKGSGSHATYTALALSVAVLAAGMLLRRQRAR
jgi:hypothetical protein